MGASTGGRASGGILIAAGIAVPRAQAATREE